MTIYETIGALVIVFFCCVGIATISLLTYRGLCSIATRAEIGKQAEDTWTREYLRPVIETFRSNGK